MWKVYVLSLSLILVFWFYLLYAYRFGVNNNTSIEFNIFEGIEEQRNESRNVSRRKINHHIPKFMLELYESAVKSEYQNSTPPDVVKSIIPKSGGVIDYNEMNEEYNHLLLFEIPPTKDDEEFLNAELKLLTIVEVSSKLKGVERFITVSIYDEGINKLRTVEETHVFHKNNTWISFNLTSQIQKLLLKKDYTFNVVISTKSFLPIYDEIGSKFKLSLLPREENFEHDYPVLLLTYNSDKKDIHRVKRNIGLDEDDDKFEDYKRTEKLIKRRRSLCRRRELYIDFAEIQYDHWIVQPAGYDAFQCLGKCFYPVADHLSPTKHAIIQSLLHTVNPLKVARTCCVPTQLSSMSILYIDQGILTYRKAYKDMVVAECGCR